MTEPENANAPKPKLSGIGHLSQVSSHLPLCQRYHVWGHISAHNLDDPRGRGDKHRYTTTSQSATIEQLAQEAQCGFCTAILRAYNARAQYVLDMQSRPAAEIGIEVMARPPRHGDYSDPDYIVVRIFLRLTVKGLPPPKAENESTIKPISSQTDRSESSPTLFTIAPQFKLTYTNDHARILTGFEEWEVRIFDIKLLSSWLKRCEDHHAGQCGGKEMRKALSYIWKVSLDDNIKLEKANVEMLTESRGLRRVQPPNIITDAINLYCSLDERYLWIDRLCIIQDDEITKPVQINAMDAIYRSANFTTVGALNTRDDIGLPGCAGRLRHLKAALWSSAYEIKSKSQGTMCAPLPERYDHVDDDSRFPGVDSDSSDSSRSKQIKLTQTGEVIGVFKRPNLLSKTVSDWQITVLGSRITAQDNDLSRATFFTPLLSDTWQSVFAGIALGLSAGGEKSATSQPRAGDCLQIASLVYFHYQDPEGGFRKLDVEERWVQNVVSIHEISQQEELPVLSGKGIPGEWRSNWDWKVCLQNPWTTYQRQGLNTDACTVAALFPGSLIFNTTVAPLKISPSSVNDDSEGKSDNANTFLVSADNEYVRSLWMVDCRWIETHCSKNGVQKLFDFVVVSGRLQEYFMSKMSAWEKMCSDIWELNVIMVERLPCKSFVARRMGIGTVTMCKWKDCSPKWETVVLL
ncbi:hypothetical protein FHL15_008788 [Xylaria flabelliformis]|uniref:Heterokaryon incompatibility domain-containing protein n=1 Tax=Xylaria flabelliformis TaxID=2512241 RepID=A0A553HQL5_9PEZI|nr:hypothetical protein FHL15_008788 [Xylaria flabelliformis]